MIFRKIPFFLVAALVSCCSDRGLAKDYYLTIGGGYNPSGNQVSLERNVIFQRQTLAQAIPNAAPPEVYFAAGDEENPTVQYRDPEFDEECPRARRMMGELFGDRREIDLCYRTHQLGEIAGPAEPGVLRRRFKKLAKELSAGDRLIVYFTGHGGEAESPDNYRYYNDDGEFDYSYEEEPYNEHDTSVYFWDNESMTASEFSDELDRLPVDVSVVLVMVQCYSGGFAHTIFRQADAELGLSDHARCGFFSQRHDRFAAGCTPEINEADYQEYSSFFWAAIGGRTRTGQTIDSADCDGDGVISMAEAHAYAVIESDTIDIPIRTTGALLRKYSTLGVRSADKEGGAANPLSSFFGALAQQGAPQQKKLIKASGPLAKLAKRARPDQKRVLEQLAVKLELGATPTVESVKGKLKQLETRQVKTNGMGSLANRSVNNARRKLRRALAERWPELTADYSPLAIALCNERSDEFVAAIDAHPAHKALEKATKRLEEAGEERENLEYLKAKAERLLRTCDNIVLAANLPIVAPAEIVERYEKLLALEESPLADPTAETTQVAGPDTEKEDSREETSASESTESAGQEVLEENREKDSNDS